MNLHEIIEDYKKQVIFLQQNKESIPPEKFKEMKKEVQTLGEYIELKLGV